MSQCNLHFGTISIRLYQLQLGVSIPNLNVADSKTTSCVIGHLGQMLNIIIGNLYACDSASSLSVIDL